MTIKHFFYLSTLLFLVLFSINITAMNTKNKYPQLETQPVDLLSIKQLKVYDTYAKKIGHKGLMKSDYFSNSYLSIAQFLYLVKIGKLSIDDGKNYIFIFNKKVDHYFKLVKIMPTQLIYKYFNPQCKDDCYNFYIAVIKFYSESFVLGQNLNDLDGKFFLYTINIDYSAPNQGKTIIPVLLQLDDITPPDEKGAKAVFGI
jgi:hypothetical protein